MRILKLKRFSDPKDPVTALATLANKLDATMELIRLPPRGLFQKLRILVGEVPQSPDPLPLTTTDAVDNVTVSTLWGINAGGEIRRSSPARNSRRDNGSAPTDQATVTESSDRSVGTLQKFFNAAMDRSDESPLDYLFRLNVAGLRARLKIKDGNAKERSEHVDHYIETLEDLDLAERLTSLRLTDADDLEEVLRARDRAKNRQKKAAFGSSKYRQKPPNSTSSAPAKQVRVIQIQANDSGSDNESDGSGGSDSDVDNHRKIFLAANEEVTPKSVSMATKITT
ncbi:hypothetical protein PHMEG_00037076, partial [Phytophthora megakarya]